MPVKKENGIVGQTAHYKIDPRAILIKEGWNPRKEFGGEEDEILKRSVISNGVLNALRVKKNGENQYELIDGERRLRATMAAIDEGCDIITVPCMIEDSREHMANSLVKSLVSNQTRPLSITEKGEAYTRLRAWDWTRRDIADATGDSYTTVKHYIEIFQGSIKVKDALKNKEITQAEAREIINTSNGDPEVMDLKVKETRKKKEQKKKEREEVKFNSSKNENTESTVEEDSSDVTDPVTEEDTVVTVSGTENIEEPEVPEENEDNVAPVSDPDPATEPVKDSKSSSSHKKNKITMDREELESLLVGATWDYKNAENEKEMVFAAGQIRALCLILDMKEPVDTDV